MSGITSRDIREFAAYLRQCSEPQVQGVYDKETKAGRTEYAELAEIEASRRGLILIRPAVFVCPRCGARSANPHDIRERYCGRCHAFVDDQPEERS
jgi:ribosomal protein S27AE